MALTSPRNQACCRASAIPLIVAALVCLPALPARAQSGPAAPPAAGRALAIEDFYRVKGVGSPELSPDGRWVAYRVTTRVEETNSEFAEVWLAPTDNSVPSRLVSPARVNAEGMQWSSDGRLSFMTGIRQWTIDPTKPDTIQVAIVDGDPRAPAGRAARVSAPSPDRKWTALVRDTPPPKREVAYASDFEKRHEERFKGVEFDWLDFQRDGQPFPVPNRLDPSVSPPQEIFLAPNDGGAERQLTRLSLRPTGVAWNHDGTRLLFTADSSYRNERVYGATQIYSVSLDGTVRRLSTDTNYSYTGARYSPDGRWILYTRQLSTDAVIRQKLDHGGATDLAIMPADGGPERLLTADWDILPTSPVWSPDSKYVYFTGGVGGANHVFRVAPNGGGVEQVTKGERRINGVSFDRDFTTHCVHGRPHRVASGGLHRAHRRFGRDARSRTCTTTFTNEVALGKAERLQFRSKDGTPIEGWLLYPYGYRPNGGPYPLVVSNHGGPHAADGYSFDFKNQSSPRTATSCSR